MIYLYAFSDAGCVELEACRGICDAPVRSVTRSRVTAVYSVHEDLDLTVNAAFLRQHDRVVTALMERCTVAPARFGTVFTDFAGLEGALLAQTPQLASALARVRGTVELAVRASDCSEELTEDDRPTTRQPGISYLRARRDAPLARLEAALAGRAKSTKVRSRGNGSMVAAYLVAAEDTGAFRDALLAVRAELPDLRVTLTGPWAPYSFVEDGGMVHA
ncbi:MAG: GvpL/GvpF family gas vesicle protein [Acidimicrobiaceae bacterium]|nr:GvpL/GvpF family gas vesicle protein [Acidimicrobiaceae bacterium]